jgi:ribose/xylose/arabinose/galactoside ABC-type transport system permease subunit
VAGSRRGLGREATLGVACALLCVVFSAAAPSFATPENAAAIFRNSVELLLIGLGMTLLLAMAAIDVSVGAAMGLAAIGVGQALLLGAPAWAAALVGPVVGVAVGAASGAVVVFGRVPPIVGTLGLFGVYKTGIFLALGGQWMSGLPDGLTRAMAARLLGLPASLWTVLVAYAAVWTALRRTPYGPHLLALGASEGAARLSGVAVDRVRFATFLASGALCGVAATFYVATYRNVEPSIGATLALEAVVAVALGGTNVMGGRCSLLGTALGVLLLRVLQNGLLLVGVGSLWQPVVAGLLLVGVFVLDRTLARGRTEAAP